MACFYSISQAKRSEINSELSKRDGLPIFIGKEFGKYLLTEFRDAKKKLKKYTYENSISKCNFADKIGKFVFFQSQEE